MTKRESDGVIVLHWAYHFVCFVIKQELFEHLCTCNTAVYQRTKMNVSNIDLLDQLKHTGKLWYLVNPYETIFEFPHQVPDYQQQVTTQRKFLLQSALR